MTATLAQIFRYPIKGIGVEALEQTPLVSNAPVPGDRAWAVAHEGAAATDAWQPRRNFVVVAYGPQLAQITARSLDNGLLELNHPTTAKLEFDPKVDGQSVLEWVRPFWPDQHSAPARFMAAPAQGMSDNGLPQVSLLNLASLRALSQKAGAPLEPGRFRGNLWVDGLAPWEEFDLIDKTVTIGNVKLHVTERIERCRATEANPTTGLRDIDVPKVLNQGWGHRDFGVYASVVTGGNISVGDPVVL